MFLVALRMSIGWYFFDGAREKNLNRSFSSSGFLAGAEGPFADLFRAGVPDFHGWSRTVAQPMEDKPNPETPNSTAWKDYNERSYSAWMKQIIDDWGRYNQKVVAHFGFDKNQAEKAKAVFSLYEGRLRGYLADSRDDIEAYRHELFLIDTMKSGKTADEVPFVKDRIATKQRSEDIGNGTAVLAGVKAMEEEYKVELLGLATGEQLDAKGNPPVSTTSIEKFDTFLKYIHFAIGACLLVGLFTRLAAFGAGTFLLLVILSRPPWIVGYQMVGYQIVMMFACFALMATPVGRWGGLDFFLHALFGNCCKGKADQ